MESNPAFDDAIAALAERLSPRALRDIAQDVGEGPSGFEFYVRAKRIRPIAHRLTQEDLAQLVDDVLQQVEDSSPVGRKLNLMWLDGLARHVSPSDARRLAAALSAELRQPTDEDPSQDSLSAYGGLLRRLSPDEAASGVAFLAELALRNPFSAGPGLSDALLSQAPSVRTAIALRILASTSSDDAPGDKHWRARVATEVSKGLPAPYLDEVETALSKHIHSASGLIEDRIQVVSLLADVAKTRASRGERLTNVERLAVLTLIAAPDNPAGLDDAWSAIDLDAGKAFHKDIPTLRRWVHTTHPRIRLEHARLIFTQPWITWRFGSMRETTSGVS
jgi:hypothetical protein